MESVEKPHIEDQKVEEDEHNVQEGVDDPLNLFDHCLCVLEGHGQIPSILQQSDPAVRHLNVSDDLDVVLLILCINCPG